MRSLICAAAPALATMLFAACSSAPRAQFTEPDAGADASAQVFERVDSGPARECAKNEADAIKPPVDFIMIVDQSGSMDSEISSVKANVNKLSGLLANSGVDYHFVMIAGTTGQLPICVPEPLAGPNCGANGSVFLPIDHHVESNDALDILLTERPNYESFLRPEALKVFIPVTDDNAYMKAPDFDAKLIGATSPFGTDEKRRYVFYPIIGAAEYPNQTDTCGSVAVNNGYEYLRLAKMTGGKWFPSCTSAFAPVFNEIGSTIAAQVACELGIPLPGKGTTLDREHVNVNLTSSTGQVTPVLQDNTAACDQGADGWQFSEDDKTVILCGATCDTVRNDPGSKVTIEFGCSTRVK
jgi:hypothetical protein